MFDLGWVAEIGKIVGGGAVGWIGYLITYRTKKRLMRKYLYKEILYNYGVMRTWVDVELLRQQLAPNQAPVSMPTWLHRDYYDHASKDQDTFNSLAEAYPIRDFYKAVDTINRGAGLDRKPVEKDSFLTAQYMADWFEKEVAEAVWNWRLVLRVQSSESRERFIDRMAVVRSLLAAKKFPSWFPPEIVGSRLSMVRYFGFRSRRTDRCSAFKYFGQLRRGLLRWYLRSLPSCGCHFAASQATGSEPFRNPVTQGRNLSASGCATILIRRLVRRLKQTSAET
ncbi:MAG: hypothetical protein QOG23_4455 [Blastocatellia bacterium]|jgi:hypothetical protein|nr:hypothetical protein [Blastocatellia bacterium]